MEDDLQAGEDGLYCVGFQNCHCLVTEQVHTEFSRFGRVVSIRGATNGEYVGWCFVRFANPEEAVRAITGMRQSPHLCDPRRIKYMAERGGKDYAHERDVEEALPRRDNYGVSPLVRGAARPPSAGQKPDQKHEVYVGNWPADLDDSSVKELFQKFDITVSDVRLYNNDTYSFAFVVVPSAKDVEHAIKSMNGGKVANHQIKVSAANKTNADHNKRNTGPATSLQAKQNAKPKEKDGPTPRQSPQRAPVRQKVGPGGGRGGGRGGGGRASFETRSSAPPSEPRPDRMPPLVLPAPPPLVLPGPPSLMSAYPPRSSHGPQNGAVYTPHRPHPRDRRDENEHQSYGGHDGPVVLHRDYPQHNPPRARELQAEPRVHERPDYWNDNAEDNRQRSTMNFEEPLAAPAGVSVGHSRGHDSVRGWHGTGRPEGYSRGPMRRSFDMRGEPESAYDEPAPFAKRARYGPGPSAVDLDTTLPLHGGPTRQVGWQGPAHAPQPPTHDLDLRSQSSKAISERIKSRLHAPMEVVVANFPAGTNEHELMSMFSKYEPLTVRIMVNNSSHHPDDFTYAYITVASRMAADEAVMEMDGLPFKGRSLVVEAKKK